MGKGAGLGRSATAESKVAVTRMVGIFVGVGWIVPVGVGKTGWKGVGVGSKAGWKGVNVGLGLGFAVTKVKGKEWLAGAGPQDVLNAINTNNPIFIEYCRQDDFMDSSPADWLTKLRVGGSSFRRRGSRCKGGCHRGGPCVCCGLGQGWKNDRYGSVGGSSSCQGSECDSYIWNP